MMIRHLPDPAEMERATLSRDESYDGLFLVAVTTTGIFCRPSCPARKPRPENMRYLASVRDCLLAGFRPCKRCRPLAVNGEAPEWLNRLVEQVERAPTARITDEDLKGMQISPYRARRYFHQSFGMTFQAYHRARRMGLALERLRRGADALEVAYDHGYSSSSGFREAFGRAFKATPGQAEGVACITTATIETPLGPMLAGVAGHSVVLLEFSERRAMQTEALKQQFGQALVPGEHTLLDGLRDQLGEYFAGRRKEFDLPLASPGTPFQEKVWARLRGIPYGATCSYEEVASSIGRPRACRAVGRANGLNRIAILIPCHRVVRSDGTLCGYGGGVWRKRHLLELERSGASPLALGGD